MDVSQYFMQKEKEFARYGAIPDELAMFHVDEGSDGKRGFLRGNLALGENAFLRVYERVVAGRKSCSREAYCYTLVIDGIHVHRWERDSRTHPEDPVHEHHGPDEVRSRNTKPVPLKKVFKRAWEEISLQAEAPLE